METASAPEPSPSAAALADALGAISSRSLQVITRALLERRSVSECARHYGISEEAFVALLARSLRELKVTSPPARGEDPALRNLCEQLRSHSPDLADAAVLLWTNGPALSVRTEEPDEESAGGRLLRVLVFAALIGALIYAAQTFS